MANKYKIHIVHNLFFKMKKLCLSYACVYMYCQGCHWSGKSPGNSRSGKSQGISCGVREILDFEKSQGNTRKSLESQGNLTFSCHTRNAANLNSLCVTIP